MTGQHLDEWMSTARDDDDRDSWRAAMRPHARTNGPAFEVCEFAKAVIFDHEDDARDAIAELNEVGAPLLFPEQCVALDDEVVHWHLVNS